MTCTQSLWHGTWFNSENGGTALAMAAAAERGVPTLYAVDDVFTLLMNLHDFATFDAVHACDTDDFFTTHNAYIFTAIRALHTSRQLPLFRCTSNVVLGTRRMNFSPGTIQMNCAQRCVDHST